MQNIGLKGSKNTRDLGGMRAVGGVVQPRMLLRGGHLHDLTRRDIATLQDDYRVRLIIDLRTDIECAERPDLEIPGAVREHMPLLDAAAVGITHEQVTEDKAAVLASLPDIGSLYRSMLHGASLMHLAEVIGLITEFAGTDGSVLFHCTEGKDRTGIVALILLWIIGVPYAGIMEDYLFTNNVAKIKAQRAYWAIRLFKRDAAAAKKIQGLLLAKKSYLDAVVDEAGREFGSMAEFIERGLGITPVQQQAFRARVLG